MVGMFALAGGDEFRPAYQEADRALVAAMPVEFTSIVIVPTAAGHQGPAQAVANGVRHFRAVAPRATVDGVMVVDATSANDPQLAARIASAGLVYLTGGDPGHLVHALRGSEALAAIAAVAARGGIVAGSSAGAMALGEVMRWGGGWEPGLGLVPGVAVLPHHANRLPNLMAARAGLPEEVVALGIPVGVTCLSRAQNAQSGNPNVWQVLGAEPITIFRAQGISQAQPGTTFTLE